MHVRMPRLGESIVEGTLVAWRVEVGEIVKRGQTLAEVETDKATSEIPAPTSGRIVALLCTVGETVAVDTPLLELSAGPEDTTKRADPSPNNAGPRLSQAQGRLHTRRIAARSEGPPHFSPAVRRLARQHDVDLHTLSGRGRGGRVTRQDVLDAVATENTRPRYRSQTPYPPPPETSDRRPRPDGFERPPMAPPSALPPVSPGEVSPFPTVVPAPSTSQGTFRPPTYHPAAGDEVVPFSRRRSQIADHMIYSLGTSAHVAAVAEIDMQRVQAARSADRRTADKRGLRLTLMAYVVRAVAEALRRHPSLNATVVDRTFVLRADCNIGIAVDTDEGVVVPVIRHADELGLLGIARAIQELSERARDGLLQPGDVSGGSFTISNPGKDGNLFGVSIIRQPEVGILRIGAIVKRPVVRSVDGEDAIVIRPIMYAALSYDHRVIDGRTGNGFLSEVARRLGGVLALN